MLNAKFNAKTGRKRKIDKPNIVRLNCLCVRLSSHHNASSNINEKGDSVANLGDLILLLLRCINHELKVNGSATVVAVMDDVLGPSLALDVDQDASWKVMNGNELGLWVQKFLLLTLDVLKLNGDNWLQVALCAHEGEILAEEALLAAQALVCEGSEIVNISGVLTLARNPNDLHVGLLRVYFDMVPQGFWHVFGDFTGFIVWRLPVVDLVELEEDARLSLFETEAFFLSAVSKVLKVNFAMVLGFDSAVFRAVDPVHAAVFLGETCWKSS
jgi:hypothetical protein